MSLLCTKLVKFLVGGRQMWSFTSVWLLPCMPVRGFLAWFCGWGPSLLCRHSFGSSCNLSSPTRKDCVTSQNSICVGGLTWSLEKVRQQNLLCMHLQELPMAPMEVCVSVQWDIDVMGELASQWYNLLTKQQICYGWEIKGGRWPKTEWQPCATL